MHFLRLVKQLTTTPGSLNGATVHDQKNTPVQLVNISSIHC